MLRIKCSSTGNIGNRMFRYAYLRMLQYYIPDSRVEGFDIPIFGLISADLPLPARTLDIVGGHVHPMSALAFRLIEGKYDALNFDGFVLRLEYYRSPDLIGSFFVSRDDPPTTIGKSELLINVRGKEVLSNLHPDYGPVPVSYFEQIANETKLTPVIMGQMGDDAYSDKIRSVFAGCRFLGPQTQAQDFSTVRTAVNIAIGVSSFSWLASWLSNTAENIHMPVSGFLNPVQRPDVDLIPTSDARYHFYKFPVEKWSGSPAQLKGLTAKHSFPKFTNTNILLSMR